jgi:hypothetical protein
LPKTLAEIAIDAGLVNKASAAKAGKMAEEKQQPLVVVLVRELGVDELALVTAFGKQTRVPLVDPKDVAVDLDALRAVPRDVCTRLRVLPLALSTDGSSKVLRVAMADPTDTSAIAELETLSQCEIDISTLPLSAIEELTDKSYRQISTLVVSRSKITPAGKALPIQESEVSVTAQIPLSSLQPFDDTETRLTALVQLLVAKGVITEAELTEVLGKVRAGS